MFSSYFIQTYTDGIKTCLKMCIKSIRPLISHRDKYTTYAVVTCEIELF